MTDNERTPEQRTENVLHLIVQRVPGISRTALVKLAYLADLEGHRYLARPLTGLKWVRDKHGPFDATGFYAAEAALEEHVLRETVPIDAHIEAHYYRAKPQLRPSDLRDAEQAIVLYVVNKYGSVRLRELLDDVVYKTEPFEAVEDEPRGTALPMNVVNNAGRKELGGINIEDAIGGEIDARAGRTITLDEWLAQDSESS